MSRRLWFWGAALLAAGFLVVATGCTRERQSAGFVLPAGNAERGRQVMARLQCNDCHSVKGAHLPPPVADPPVGVELGRVVLERRTDGELVTAIIDPSHEISQRWAAGVMEVGGRSRMGDYSQILTVRDLCDIVAFLRTTD